MRSIPEILQPPLRAFGLAPGRCRFEAIGAGHINDSYLVACPERRYVLQRVNTNVFRSPERVMANMVRVTEHVRAGLRARGTRDVERRCLRLLPTHDDEPCHWDEQGSPWRLLPFVEDTVNRLAADRPATARAAAAAFGDFQVLLADLDPGELGITIPDFHETPARLDQLDRARRDAADGGRAERLDEVGPELAAIEDRRELAHRLTGARDAGRVPSRVSHNDAKLSNVLLDRATGEPLCVIDLDTVMPGLSLYDFGDMARSMSHTTAEDELRLGRVEVRPELFAAVAAGYLSTAGALLTDAERELLVDAAEVLILEQAARFLADYLDGDRYFRVHRPRHNLERTRAQLALLESFERHDAELRDLVKRIASANGRS